MNRVKLVIMLLLITVVASGMAWISYYTLSSQNEEQHSVSTVPNCRCTVSRFELTTKIRLNGSAPKGSSIVAIFAPPIAEHTSRLDFGIEADGNFYQDYDIEVPKTENMIPMVFMFSRDKRHQYVCRLLFIHIDSSALSPEELDGMMRTKVAADSREIVR